MNGSSATHGQAVKSRGRRIARPALYVVLVGFLLCAGFLGYVRFWMDGAQVARLVVPRLEASLGKRISYRSMDLAWTSPCGARITASDLEVRDTRRTPVDIRVPKLVVDLSLKSVWRGTVLLNRIRVVRPVLRIGDDVDRHANSRAHPLSPAGGS